MSTTTTAQNPFDAERRAWQAVADNPPGSPNHDVHAWAAWMAAAEASSPAGLEESGWDDLR